MSENIENNGPEKKISYAPNLNQAYSSYSLTKVTFGGTPFDNPSYDFLAFKYKARRDEAFEAFGINKETAEIDKLYNQQTKGWGKDIHNKDLTSAVAASIEIQYSLETADTNDLRNAVVRKVEKATEFAKHSYKHYSIPGAVVPHENNETNSTIDSEPVSQGKSVESESSVDKPKKVRQVLKYKLPSIFGFGNNKAEPKTEDGGLDQVPSKIEGENPLLSPDKKNAFGFYHEILKGYRPLRKDAESLYLRVSRLSQETGDVYLKSLAKEISIFCEARKIDISGYYMLLEAYSNDKKVLPPDDGKDISALKDKESAFKNLEKKLDDYLKKLDQDKQGVEVLNVAPENYSPQPEGEAVSAETLQKDQESLSAESVESFDKKKSIEFYSEILKRRTALKDKAAAHVSGVDDIYLENTGDTFLRSFWEKASEFRIKADGSAQYFSRIVEMLERGEDVSSPENGSALRLLEDEEFLLKELEEEFSQYCKDHGFTSDQKERVIVDGEGKEGRVAEQSPETVDHENVELRTSEALRRTGKIRENLSILKSLIVGNSFLGEKKKTFLLEKVEKYLESLDKSESKYTLQSKYLSLSDVKKVSSFFDEWEQYLSIMRSSSKYVTEEYIEEVKLARETKEEVNKKGSSPYDLPQENADLEEGLSDEQPKPLDRSPENVEKVRENLKKRNEGNFEKLKKFGVKGIENIKDFYKKSKPGVAKALKVMYEGGGNGLVKSFEKMEKMDPKYVYAAAASLAALSAATGGSVSVITLAFSAMSTASPFYKKTIEKMLQTSSFVSDERKRKAAVRAIFIGAALSFTAKTGFEAVGHAIGEQFSSLFGHSGSTPDVPVSGGDPVTAGSSVSASPEVPAADTHQPQTPAAPDVQTPIQGGNVTDPQYPQNQMQPVYQEHVVPQPQPQQDLVKIAQDRNDELVAIAKRAAGM